MKIYPSLKKLSEECSRDSLGITIGNFDGVHLGHQGILEGVLKSCRENSLKLCVLTFVPHPRQILLPECGHHLLNTFEERRELLEKLGVDYLVELKFGRDFSTLSPEEFLDNYLLSSGKVKKIFLGYDFSFGQNKAGDFDFAKNYLKETDVEVIKLSEVKVESSQVSSSEIRSVLKDGEVEKAMSFLGRNYFLRGVVKKGDGRGRKIGFPTANTEVDSTRLIPKQGVYITQTLYHGMLFNSITNIGFNPTFKERGKLSVETHLFDFDSIIYGEEIEVRFLSRLRDEIKFESVNKLIDQIGNDVEKAKKYFLA